VFFPEKHEIMKRTVEKFAYDLAIPISRRQTGTNTWVFQT